MVLKSESPKSIADADLPVSVSEEQADKGQPEGHAESPQPENEEVPDISILHGLCVERDGTLIDSKGRIVGEVFGGLNPIRLWRYACNDRGEIWSKGKIIGRARLVESGGVVGDGL